MTTPTMTTPENAGRAHGRAGRPAPRRRVPTDSQMCFVLAIRHLLGGIGERDAPVPTVTVGTPRGRHKAFTGSFARQSSARCRRRSSDAPMDVKPPFVDLSRAGRG